jgi:hypothetical protein
MSDYVRKLIEVAKKRLARPASGPQRAFLTALMYLDAERERDAWRLAQQEIAAAQIRTMGKS